MLSFIRESKILMIKLTTTTLFVCTISWNFISVYEEEGKKY